MQQEGGVGAGSRGALDGQEDRLGLALDRLKSVVPYFIIPDIECKGRFLLIVFVFRRTFFS